MYKSFVKDKLMSLIAQALVYSQGIIMVPIIIKTVGVATYGGYVLLMSILSFVVGISSFGIGFKYERFFPSTVDLEAKQSLFFPQLFFKMASVALLSVLLIFLAPLTENMFSKAVSFSIVLPSLYLLANLFYTQVSEYFRLTGRMNLLNFAAVACPYLNIFILLLVYYRFHELTVNILVFSQVLSMTLVTIPILLKMFKEIGIGTVQLNVKDYIEDFKLGFPVILGFIVGFILNTNDRYVIAFYMSIKDVGYYAPAYALGTLIVFFPKVSQVVLPQLLSRAVDGGREDEARNMVDYSIKAFLLVCIPFVAGAYVMSKPILSLLANKEVAEHAYLVAPIVALGTLFYGLNIILYNVLIVRMKTVKIFRMNLIGVVVNILLNFTILYFFRNIVVAAFTTLLCYIIVFCIMHSYISSDWPVNYSIKSVLRSVVASTAMCVLLLLIQPTIMIYFSGITAVVCDLMLGVFVYAVVLLAVGTFSLKELACLKHLFLNSREVEHA